MWHGVTRDEVMPPSAPSGESDQPSGGCPGEGIQTVLRRDHAMTWTHSYGMKDIGVLPGGLIARAWATNNYGQVVGGSALKDPAVYHAFVWTHASGMIDLNKRTRNLPNGMVLQSALAISDNGSIVVQTNTAPALLKPHRYGCGAAVGPFQAPAVVAARPPYLVSARLADEDTSAVSTRLARQHQGLTDAVSA